MNNNKKIIISMVLILSLIAGASYYYFVDTLSLSQIVGKTNSSIANIGLKIFDFDTGLTRFDISGIKSKSPYWMKQIEEINTISNGNVRSSESMKLIEEMLDDPGMCKIAKTFGVGGIKKIYSIIKFL